MSASENILTSFSHSVAKYQLLILNFRIPFLKKKQSTSYASTTLSVSAE